MTERINQLAADSAVENGAGPLLTWQEYEQMLAARRAGMPHLDCSLDLGRSQTRITIGAEAWEWRGRAYPYLDACQERSIYYWADGTFEPAARYTTGLIKLVPTRWGAPTFEIDGIKMLPTARISPYEDARDKVALIQPRGKVILDTCGGLGYFAAWCVQGGARRVLSFEKHPDVMWLRGLNSWSPPAGGVLQLSEGDIGVEIVSLDDASVDAALHDPPRFGIAGELYSQIFYEHLARVLKRKGRLFHYTGAPNKLTSGRDVSNEVAKRLRRAGFAAEPYGDGVLAVKR